MRKLRAYREIKKFVQGYIAKLNQFTSHKTVFHHETLKYLPDFGKHNIASYLCTKIFFYTHKLKSNFGFSCASITSGIKICITSGIKICNKVVTS